MVQFAFRILSAISLVAGFTCSQAFAEDSSAAPVQSIHAVCIIFAYSLDDGNVSKDLLNSAEDLQLNTPVEILKTSTATYKATLNNTGRIFIDVLTPSGSRIAAAFGEITLGTSIVEPNMQTQVFCFPH